MNQEPPAKVGDLSGCEKEEGDLLFPITLYPVYRPDFVPSACMTRFFFKVSKRAEVPNLSGIRDRFHGRQLFHGRGLGGMVQAVL